MGLKRIQIICFVGFVYVFSLNAQHQPLLGHYMIDPFLMNPGAAGNTERVFAILDVRNQWQGIPGAPNTYFASINLPFNLLGKQHGFGFTAMNDQIANNNNISFSLAYAYRFPVGNGKMGIGLKGGIYSYSLKADEWVFPENNYQTEVPNLALEFSDFMLDMDFGVFYKTDELFLSLSSTMINSPTTSPRAENKESTYFGPELVRHYHLMSGYSIYLKNNSFELKPSFYIRSDAKTLSFDLSTMLMYNKKLWTGVSYRNDFTSYGIVFAGIELMKDLNIGFSYDIPSNNIIEFSKLTLEFFVNYNFTLGGEKVTQRYKSIRYL